MIEILAHRGNVAGPAATTEHSLDALDTCLANGWGVEVDIRRTGDGRFYLSHDAWLSPLPSAAAAGQEPGLAKCAESRPDPRHFCTLLRRYPHATVALNVKELGYEAALIDFLREQEVLSQMFLFDMELLESHPGETAALLRALDGDVRLAARVSDRGEPIERALGIESADVIWLDEFDRQWATARDVRRLRNAGRTIYAVSPDLHGYPLDVARRRWEDFIAWGVHGICTDYPVALAGTVERLKAIPA
jgi:glycerophosphoryl diester phosphodiesterase